MSIRSFKVMLFGSLVVLLLSGCSLPGGQVAAKGEDVIPVTATPARPPTATPIVHQDVPGELPAERSSLAGDQDSSQTAAQRRAPGGDRFTFSRFERPFNADMMDVYFPYIDIQNTLVYQDDTWIFAEIVLQDGDANQALPARYATEIDSDQDGRGDWLVLVSGPKGSDWLTAGVQVWSDSNDDVGGATVLYADQGSSSDGYETLEFDDGNGDDPDLAWARISPLDPHTVQIAVKNAILAGDRDFMVGMWAGSAQLDPARFDLNDQYTHEQAGAALVEFEYFYPVKALSELDNSCRMAIGFTPKGSEPGLCPSALPEPTGPCPPEQNVCYNFGNQTVCFCLEP